MKEINYDFERIRFMGGFDKKTCKILPYIASDDKSIYVSYSILDLNGIDKFTAEYVVKSTDGGKTFSSPNYQKNCKLQKKGNLLYAYSTNIFYNKKYKKFFGIGNTATYFKDRPAPCNCYEDGKDILEKILYYDFNEKNCQFVNKKEIESPLKCNRAIHVGRIEEYANGDMLIPFYCDITDKKTQCITARYRFVNGELRLVKAGSPISMEKLARGVCEPTIAKLNKKFYMTLRSDEQGMFAVSEDGFNFSKPKPWVYDDKSILENYNTQTHWLVNKNGLFLAYTRKGANNDHVFRHRAPIFIARFNEDKQCLIKSTERILVPELGARLGNFDTFEPNNKESWLITAEWMQSWNQELGICEKYGSDNSFWLIKLLWK
ncbi:MAG: hypothetical protein MJ066_01880 [Clostridia bacterium]|nr:hypothetical protein [Clostridia bacterium]